MSGDAALGAFTGGVLLIYVECNWPGRVVPGAAGLLLATLGAHRLASLPASSMALWLLGAGLLGMVATWGPRYQATAGGLGSSLLAAGGFALATESHGGLSRWWAASCAFLLGALGASLLSVAGRARRLKRASHPAVPPGSAAIREHWGVD